MTLELLARLQNLYSGVISDTLQFDVKREENYVTDPPHICIGYKGRVICGPAFTCIGEEYEEDKDRLRIEMLSYCREGQIQVIDIGTNKESCRNIAHYGDISAMLAKKSGLKACLLNGNTRDSEIMPTSFNIFCEGIHPKDAYGSWQIGKYNVPVKYKDIVISPNDILHISADGVIRIPNDILYDVIVLSEERAKRERHVRKRIVCGHNLLDIYNEEKRW